MYSIWCSVLPGRPQLFRDPVHGDIEYARGPFQQVVRALVDTEIFQRLRGIRQNGVVNLVFHGAEHSRFTHSMGVAWVARKMFESAARNSALPEATEANEATILAALLHDVGHGPFSHLLEEILTKKVFDHEKLTIRLLTDPESQICKHLRDFRADLPEIMVPFIDKHKRTQPHWYYEIVSSQLDADRLDYLARDGYMAGIQTHQFDARRLVGFLGVKAERLVVDIRARDVLENYLLALDQMYQSVYYHHTVRAASRLVMSAIQRAVDVARESGKPEEIFPTVAGRRDPFWALAVEGANIPVREYARLDEPHIWVLFRFWREAKDEILRDLCERFATRRFPKALPLSPDLDFRGTKELEDEVSGLWKARAASLTPKYYVAVDEPDRVGYKRYKSGEGPAQSVMVADLEDAVRPIEELPRSIVSVIEHKFVARRLIVPSEIADEVHQVIKEKT